MDFYPVYVIILFLQIVVCELKYVCKKKNDPDIQANLTCNNNHMIHVISETYGNGTLQQGCLNTKTCTEVLRNDSQGLDVNCNGKQNCSEETAPDSATHCSPVQGNEIQYECVEDSLDVCRTREELTNESVYFHSPNFPDSARVNDSCTCRITGTLMSIQLIQHRDRKKDLNISTDGDNLPQGVTPVNRIIVQRANDTTLNYQGMEDGRFWFKVTGLGMIDVNCLNEYANMLSTSMATKTPNTTKESSSTGVGLFNVTCNDDETNDMQSTTMDTTTTGTTKESSGAGRGMVTSPNPTYEMSTVTSDTGTIDNTDLSSDTASSTVPASTIVQPVTSTESNDGTGTHRTDVLNSTVIVGGVCGVIILILIITIISLLVCFKELKPSRGEAINTAHADMLNLDTNTRDSLYDPVTNSTLDTSAPDSDEQRSFDANNTYSGLSLYENQDGQHEYGEIHVYGNTCI